MNQDRMILIPAVLLVVTWSGTAFANEPPPPITSRDGVRLGLAATAGLGGRATTSFDDGSATTVAMLPTFGGSVRLVAPLHAHFTLGGDVGAFFMNTKSWEARNAGRSLLAVADVVPRLRHRFEDDGIEIYLATPVGLVVSQLDDAVVLSTGPPVDQGVGIGWHVSLLAGASSAMSSTVSVFLEIGFAHHAVQHETVDVSTSQFQMNAGIDFAL